MKSSSNHNVPCIQAEMSLKSITWQLLTMRAHIFCSFIKTFDSKDSQYMYVCTLYRLSIDYKVLSEKWKAGVT